MSESNDQPPAKRVKLEEELIPSTSSPSLPTTTTTEEIVPTSKSVLKYLTPIQFSFEGEKGLFGLVFPSLGFRASTEEETGILEYVDGTIPPFSGIIKHRFTDFLVFEVGLDGETVRLKDIEGPARAPKAPKVEAVAGGSGVASVPTWDEACEISMSPLLSSEKLLELKEFILAGPAAVVKKPKAIEGEVEIIPEVVPEIRAFQSEVIESKEARGEFHKAIRETFASKLASEVKVQEDGKQFINVVWSLKSERKHQPRAVRSERLAESGESKYIHFTLQKTNKEMHDALSGLCRTLHLTARDLGTAGTKDKRAVTVQRVSMKKGSKTLEDVWRAVKVNPNAGRGRGGRGRGGGSQFGSGGSDRGVRIGDVAYGDVMFDLGMLKGNKFVITLRDVKVDSPETITRAMETLKTQGFINYFGMQRFGTAPIPTHVVGLALLRSDWALAAHLLLRPRDGESDEVALPRLIHLEGKTSEALRLIPRRAVAERAILEHYAAHGQLDHLSAINRIPKNLRMMYVHSYQSYVWNKVVSERVKLFGCDKPIVGDLVYSDPTTAGDGEVEIKTDLSKIESLEANLDDDDEEPIQATGLGKVSSKVPKVQALTQEDINAGTYTMADVILPMPGFSIVYPTGQLGDLYRNIMKSDKLDPENLYRKQKEFSLGGAYRKIMHKPSDVSHRLITYSSTAQDLAQSDEDIILKRPAPPVTPYDPTVPLPLGHSLALQLELTLGSSTYATMALREVLKDKTSSTHQSGLTSAMEERAKVEGAKLEALNDLEKMKTEEEEAVAV